MTPLNANQIRHLERVVENPGRVLSGCNALPGWNAGTYTSLQRRGLIVSDASTGWRYHPTAEGRLALTSAQSDKATTEED